MWSVLSRHRQLLGGTHDYDGRRILKRRKSADKAGSFRGTGGKAGPQPSIAEDDEEEGQQLHGPLKQPHGGKGYVLMD